MAVYIRADKLYENYSRKVTDILTLLGDLGGLQEFFLLVGGLLIGFITQKIFMSSIIKKTYHIRKYENIEDEMNKKLARQKGGLVVDDESRGKSERNKIMPVDTQNEGGEDEEGEDNEPKDPFQL